MRAADIISVLLLIAGLLLIFLTDSKPLTWLAFALIIGKLRYVIARALRLPQQRTDTVGRRKILFAHTVTDSRRLHHRHTAKPCHKMFQ